MGVLRWRFASLTNRFASRRSFFLAFADRWEREGRNREAFAVRSDVTKIDLRIKKVSVFDGGVFGWLQNAWNVYRLGRACSHLNNEIKPVWRQTVESIVIVVAFAVITRTFLFNLYHIPTGSAEPNMLVGDRICGNKLVYRFGLVKRGDLVIFNNPNFSYDRHSSLNAWWQRYIGLPIPLLGLDGGPDAWVKRVVAVPGDWVEGCIKHGKPVIYVNGEKADEPYVNPYPLIGLRKKVGLFDSDILGAIPLFSTLRSRKKEVFYSYDPNKSLDKQPFYCLSADEILRDKINGKPVMRRPDVGEERDSFVAMRVPNGKYWVMGDSRKNSDDSRVWNFLDEPLITGRASFILFSVDSEEDWFFLELLKSPVSFWTQKLRWGRFFRWLHPFKKLPQC